MNIYNPPTASEVIGLGTAAVKNTGTSGDAVPVLNGAIATWAAGAVFGAAIDVGAGNLTLTSNGTYFRGTLADGSTVTRYLGLTAGDLCLVGPFDTASESLINGGGGLATFGGSVDVGGEARCNSLRIDAAPSAETPSATHTAVINLNGTAYKFLCLAA